MKKRIAKDIKRLIKLLEADRRLRPAEFHLPDAYFRAMGANPNDYPKVEGHPTFRRVRAR